MGRPNRLVPIRVRVFDRIGFYDASLAAAPAAAVASPAPPSDPTNPPDKWQARVLSALRPYIAFASVLGLLYSYLATVLAGRVPLVARAPAAALRLYGLANVKRSRPESGYTPGKNHTPIGSRAKIPNRRKMGLLEVLRMVFRGFWGVLFEKFWNLRDHLGD